MPITATIFPLDPSNLLDLSTVNNEMRIPTLSYTTMSLHASSVGSSAWSAGVVTLEWSNNQADWFAFPTATTIIAGAPTEPTLDVSTFAFVRLRTSTAESGVTLRIGACLKTAA